ncbi:MAG: hypothetical protein GX049_10460 [Alcaligenaceae bacterium]|nr:hypothetical protein [Alcaligenaceae bacterium]
MKSVRAVGRVLVPFGLVFLAACQTPQGGGVAQAPDAAAQQPASAPAQAPATPPASAPADSSAQASQGAPVAVYLADTVQQEGWVPISIQSGNLYLNPEPVLTREDLTGVQAGANQQGAGLLALDLSEEGRQKVTRLTSRYPNKRLALVVGRTMLAAPGYTTPVTSGQLVFAVGTEQNAMLAARAIAGLPEDGSGDNAASQGANVR